MTLFCVLLAKLSAWLWMISLDILRGNSSTYAPRWNILIRKLVKFFDFKKTCLLQKLLCSEGSIIHYHKNYWLLSLFEVRAKSKTFLIIKLKDIRIIWPLKQNIAKSLLFNSIDNTLTVHFILNFWLVQDNFMYTTWTEQ